MPMLQDKLIMATLDAEPWSYDEPDEEPRQWNSTKCAVCEVLRRVHKNPNIWLTFKQLVDYTGVDADYLAHRLPLWVHWRIVKRKLNLNPVKGHGDRLIYIYRLDLRGFSFVNWASQSTEGPYRVSYQSVCKRLNERLAARRNRGQVG